MFLESLLYIKQQPKGDFAKGKVVVGLSMPNPKQMSDPQQGTANDVQWEKPSSGWVKLNVDGALSRKWRQRSCGWCMPGSTMPISWLIVGNLHEYL